MTGLYDDYDLGPGYWDDGADDALEEAFAKGHASRDAEVAELRMHVDDIRAELAAMESERDALRIVLGGNP